MTAAYTNLQAGRYAEALSLIEEGQRIAGHDLTLGRALFGFSYAVWFAGVRAALLTLIGRIPEATEQLVRAQIAIATDRGQGAQALAHVALARALCEAEGRKARKAVEAALDEATKSISETGARGLEPIVLEARGELARVCGDRTAREHFLRGAHELYVEMSATGHARRLARELGF